MKPNKKDIVMNFIMNIMGLRKLWDVFVAFTILNKGVIISNAMLIPHKNMSM